ncbi:MAG: hypothetical protein ACP5RN_08210 [Armatimonadota bacterium]
MWRIILSFCAGIACATVWAQKVDRIPYKGWQEAYRLSNGTVEVVVVPSIARIMHYGFVGEPNVLWVNPATEGVLVKPGEWPNHGGDKAWVWPQDEWEARVGRGWPPPSATDQVPHQVEVIGSNIIRLTSPLVAGYGVRIVRDIRLEPSGTRVHILTRLEKVRDGADFPVAAWVVAQLPAPELLLARLHPGSTLTEGYRLFSPDLWKAVRRLGADILLPERRSDVAVKLGCDAEILAWFKSPYLVVHRSPIGKLSDFKPGDHAQIFSNSDVLPYIELEFTSPLRVLRKGESVSLEVTWELYRVPPDKGSPEELAVFLRAM